MATNNLANAVDKKGDTMGRVIGFSRNGYRMLWGAGETLNSLAMPLDSLGSAVEGISSAFIDDLERACPGLGIGNAVRVMSTTLSRGIGVGGVFGGFGSTSKAIKDFDTANSNAAASTRASAEALAASLAQQQRNNSNAWSNLALGEALVPSGASELQGH